MTLLDTIRLIENLAAAQPAVHMIVRQDARRLNDCPDARYGAFAWVQSIHKATVTTGIIFEFNLFYIDRLTADRKNETEIQSIGVQVLDNVIHGLYEADGVIDILEYTFTPFDYRFADECAGVYTTVRIEVDRDTDCEADYGFTQTIKII